MDTKTLSSGALAVIDQYLHFKVGQAVCSVPYFNNKTVMAKAALRARVGKGSPTEIAEEIGSFIVRQHISKEVLADETLKQILSDNGLGIDCSGFAYYILDAESAERGQGALEKKLAFVNCSGFFGKMRCSLKPAENCDVATLAHDENSRVVPLEEAQPGDMITMLSGTENVSRNHIMVIHQVERHDQAPMRLNYSHAIAYPEDGLYGSGVRQGSIEIIHPMKPLIEQNWIEDGKTGDDNRLLARAKGSKTELRRLKWL